MSLNEKIKVGDIFECKRTYSQKEVEEFAKVSKDFNPIHLDEEYAKNTIFKKPIVHGFLSGSIFSKIIGTNFPGHGSIYLSQTMQFKRPVFAGEEYCAYIEVTEVKKEKKIGILKTIFKTKNNKILIEGTAVVKNTKRF